MSKLQSANGIMVTLAILASAAASMSDARAAAEKCQDPMKYKTTPFRTVDRESGKEIWDIGVLTDQISFAAGGGESYTPLSCLVLLGEMAKSDHKRFLASQGCPGSGKKICADAELITASGVSAIWETDLEDALEAGKKVANLGKIKLNEVGGVASVDCKTNNPRWCSQTMDPAEAAAAGQATVRGGADLFDPEGEARQAAAQGVLIASQHGVSCAHVPAGFEGTMEIVDAVGNVTKAPAYCAHPEVVQTMDQMGYRLAATTAWSDVGDWLGNGDWWSDMAMGAANTFLPSGSMKGRVYDARTGVDTKTRVATFKRYQVYLMQQIWGGLSADERARVAKNGACTGSSVFKTTESSLDPSRPTTKKKEGDVYFNTFIDICKLDANNPDSFFKYMGAEDVQSYLTWLKSNGRGVDAMQEAARFCIYNDLLDNGMETAWSATNLLVGLVGGAVATGVVSAGVAASAPTFGASGVGAFAVGFAAGETVEVGMAAMEVYHRCEQYREIVPGLTSERVWGMAKEALAAPIGMAQGGVCSKQDSALVISDSRAEDICKECVQGIQNASIGFVLGTVINAATGGVGELASGVKTAMVKELVGAMSTGGEKAVAKMIAEWAVSSDLKKRMFVGFLRGDSKIVGMLGFNLKGSIDEMVTRMGRAGVAPEGVQAFKETLERLAVIAKGKSVPATFLAEADEAVLRRAGQALREEAEKKGVPVSRVASWMQDKADGAAGMVRAGLKDAGHEADDAALAASKGAVGDAVGSAEKGAARAGGRETPGDVLAAAAREGRAPHEPVPDGMAGDLVDDIPVPSRRYQTVTFDKKTGGLRAVDEAGETQVLKKGERVVYNGQPATIESFNNGSGRVTLATETAERGVSRTTVPASALGKGALSNGYDAALEQEARSAARMVAQDGRPRTVGGVAYVKAADGNVAALRPGEGVSINLPGGTVARGTVDSVESRGAQAVGRNATHETAAGAETTVRVRTADGKTHTFTNPDASVIAKGEPPARSLAQLAPPPRLEGPAKERVDGMFSRLKQESGIAADPESELYFDQIAYRTLKNKEDAYVAAAEKKAAKAAGTKEEREAAILAAEREAKERAERETRAEMESLATSCGGGKG